MIEEREERPAYVRFERRAVESKTKSLEAGRSVSVDVDFALVTPPYSRDLHENTADAWFNNVRKSVRDGRTPQKWLDHWERSYKAFKDGQEAPINGTPIKEWSAISPAQIKNLMAINILTIEDLAAVNDQGMARIGMGAVDLKRKAQNWLKAASDLGPVTMRISELEKEVSRLKLANDDLVDKNRTLMNQLESSKQPVYAQQTNEISIEDITDPPVRTDTFTMANVPEQSEMTRDQLIGAHIRKFGKPPHPNAKDETIRSKLLEE